MQTFLPYPDFERTAKVLDYRRLGKQRIEAKQILQLLIGERDNNWKHHPAVKMWAGHEAALVEYAIAICQEWRQRGYIDNQLDVFRDYQKKLGPVKYPPWMGSQSFHLSHRQALMFKNSEHYKKYFRKVTPKLDYIWPVL